MFEFIKTWHLDALLGALLLAYVVFAKVSEYRFRKRAILVRGEVLKVFPHSRFTSYFMTYSLAGTSRVAEYCGMPMIREYEVGDVIEVLVDGNAPPDVQLPEKWHNAPGAHSGNCSLPGSAIVTVWDLVYVLAGVALIARSFGLVQWRLGG